MIFFNRAIFKLGWKTFETFRKKNSAKIYFNFKIIKCNCSCSGNACSIDCSIYGNTGAYCTGDNNVRVKYLNIEKKNYLKHLFLNPLKCNVLCDCTSGICSIGCGSPNGWGTKNALCKEASEVNKSDF